MSTSTLLLLRQKRAKGTGLPQLDPVRTLIRIFLSRAAGEEVSELEVPVVCGDYRERFSGLAETIAERKPTTVVVDWVDPCELNPLKGGSWSSLIAMLVLAFPDIRWLFEVIQTKENVNIRLGVGRELLAGFRLRFHAGRVAERSDSHLFDGDGLRKWIRERMREDAQGNRMSTGRDRYDSRVLPCRDRVALVLDEESGYRKLLGLMCYVRGFRVWTPSSWSEAASCCRVHSPDLELTIEDFFLNFSDQPFCQMSDLRRRSGALPALRLEPPPLRRFLTVGHQQQKADRIKEREERLKELRTSESQTTGARLRKSNQVAYKPASGLYTLWREFGLHRAWGDDSDSHLAGLKPLKRRGLAPGFRWPPVHFEGHDGENEGHSSPGRLLQIAEHLVARANTLIDSVNTVTEAVRGAVLATQALELLGGKTPTVSVEAMLLKHAFEVTAECQFVGVEYHLSMKERLDDIRKNLLFMSRWLHKTRLEEFKLNAEAMIVTRLIATLDKYGEYEESQTCQRRLRTLHHKIAHRNDLRRRPVFAVLSWPFHAYIEFVLRSLGHFTVAIAGLMLIFTILFMVTLGKSFLDALNCTMLAVFTVSIGEEDDPLPAKLVAYSTAAAGMMNFGLLVAYLYSKMVRK